MKKGRLLLLGLLLCAQLLFAQNRTVTGRITDANGSPLAGVTVTATETNTSTVTGANGTYSLTLPASARSLTFTYVGFTSQTVALGTNNTVNANLAPSSGELAAVVVTGYGNVERSKYAGASSKVSEAAIRNVPVGSFEQILQGRAPGLTVLSSGGQPGANANVILRGPTSIEGGSSPLYIVDGIPVEAGVFQSINPNDIASVDVLKDASSAAMYGSRGAAGVIVVTTKRGKAGKMRLGFTTQQGIKFAPQFGYTPMTSDQLFNAQEALGKFIPNSTLSVWGTLPTLPGWQYSPNNPNKLVGTSIVPKTAADFDFGRRQLDSLRAIRTDWFDEFFDNGRFSNNEVSFSGGEGRTRIYTNLGYYQEDGILKPTNMKRATLRTNADYRDEKLTLSLSSIIGYTRRNLQANPLNGFNAFINPFGVPQLTPQYITPRLPNGKYNVGAAFPFFAPTMLDKIVYDKVYNDQGKITASLSVNYDFTKNVYAGVLGGIDFRETQNTTYNDPRPFNTRTNTNVRTRSGSVTEGLARFFQPNGRAYVGYRNTFGDHSIDVTGYAEVLKTYAKTFTAQGFGVDTLRPNTIAAVTAGNATNQLFQVVGGTRSQRTLNSLLGIVRYNFKNKYSITGSYRYDGVSSLPEKNRFQGFYSVGAIWDVTREAFMQNATFANALRLKLSYGQAANVDNFPFGDFGYLGQFNTNTNLVSGLSGITVALDPTTLDPLVGNPEGDWEFTNTANLGIEFGFFRNRLYGDIQLYNKLTKNLFASLSLSATSGFRKQDVNAGEMFNRGIEYNFNYDIISRKNLVWTITANGAYNKNEVTNLGPVNSYESGTELVVVGKPIGSHYSVKWAGVDAATGAPLYYTKDGKITTTYSLDNRVQEFGTWIPSVTGGFGTSLRYKGLEFSSFFNYARNTYRSNNMEFFLQNPGFLQQGLNQDANYTFWTKPGDVANVQSPLYQNNFSSRLIQDASWLRLRNVTLAYTLPQTVLGKLRYLSEARIYVTGMNLLTWTKWRGLDPEDDNNISSTEYPNPRAITAGIEIRF